MSPSRTPTTYRPPRARREVFFAVLGVAVVLAIAVALIWVLAPEEEEPIDLPEFVPPVETTVPGASTTLPVTPTTLTPTTSPG